MRPSQGGCDLGSGQTNNHTCASLSRRARMPQAQPAIVTVSRSSGPLPVSVSEISTVLFTSKYSTRCGGTSEERLDMTTECECECGDTRSPSSSCTSSHSKWWNMPRNSASFRWPSPATSNSWTICSASSGFRTVASCRCTEISMSRTMSSWAESFEFSFRSTWRKASKSRCSLHHLANRSHDTASKDVSTERSFRCWFGSVVSCTSTTSVSAIASALRMRSPVWTGRLSVRTNTSRDADGLAKPLGWPSAKVCNALCRLCRPALRLPRALTTEWRRKNAVCASE
mmetsp:Transcript_119803/g.339551  ORF Transcript_119803/g.339551 Transcript_119803/m.339551 type:complete len:285 (-) Transcript_119803:64-918(-)